MGACRKNDDQGEETSSTQETQYVVDLGMQFKLTDPVSSFKSPRLSNSVFKTVGLARNIDQVTIKVQMGEEVLLKL